MLRTLIKFLSIALAAAMLKKHVMSLSGSQSSKKDMPVCASTQEIFSTLYGFMLLLVYNLPLLVTRQINDRFKVTVKRPTQNATCEYVESINGLTFL